MIKDYWGKYIKRCKVRPLGPCLACRTLLKCFSPIHDYSFFLVLLSDHRVLRVE